MEREEELHDELKDMSFGPSVKRSNMAPDGYFDTLPDQVMNRWLLENKKAHQVGGGLSIYFGKHRRFRSIDPATGTMV